MAYDRNLNSLAGRKIGFFGRGGAGKSTTVVLIARALAEAGYTVCIVDADSTNIGLHQALGIERSPSPLIDYFGGMVFSGGAVTCPVDDPTPLDGAEISLDALPDEKTELFLRRKLAAHGIEPIGVIHDDTNIAEAWLTGSLIEGSNTRLEVGAIVQTLRKPATEMAAVE